jgi:hypothetical protein
MTSEDLVTKRFAFDRHHIRREQIKAIHDHIIVCDMSFDRRVLNSGLILPGDNGTGEGIYPRWGRVYAVGPEQHEVVVDQWVMVEHGRWTRGLDIEDESGKKTIRRVDPKCILMVTDDEADTQRIQGSSTSVHVQKQTA